MQPSITPPPQILIIAGPNGAGKSTSASVLVPADYVFVNADEIAKELAGEQAAVAIRASRIMSQRLDDLESERRSFAVETTLATKSLVHRITRLRAAGYRAHLFFVWLPDVELAISRVAERVREGGHNIPEPTIRRRYRTGLDNFFSLYRPLVDTWRIYDNPQLGNPQLIALGDAAGSIQVYDLRKWSKIESGATE